MRWVGVNGVQLVGSSGGYSPLFTVCWFAAPDWFTLNLEDVFFGDCDLNNWFLVRILTRTLFKKVFVEEVSKETIG